jgi:hypothetical protein
MVNRFKFLFSFTFLAVAAFAGPVAYNTNSSTLLCGSAVNCVQNPNDQSVTLGGTFTLSYNQLTAAVNAPTNISYGTFQSSGTGNVSFVGLAFNLTVTETVPGGSGSFPAASFTGTGTGTSSNGFMSFAGGNTLSIGSDLYTAFNDPIVPPTTNNGVSSIEGNVRYSNNTPEPTTALLLGGGLLCLGLLRRTRNV